MAAFRTLIRAFALAGCASSALQACQGSEPETAHGSGGAPLASGGRADTSGQSGVNDVGGVTGGAGEGGARGDAGSVDQGGAAGTVGGGAAGSGEAGAIGVGGGACLPEPLAGLVAPCPLADGCSFATTDEGLLDVCYASGDRTRLIPSGDGNITTVKSANGSLCYVLESTVRLDLTPNRQDYVWLNGERAILATGRIEESALDVLDVSVEGVRYRVDLGSDVCQGVAALPRGTERCELGACSF